MSVQRDFDIEMMRLSLKLARKGMGRTSPNPLVGAVLAKEKRVIGEGFHRKAGDDHAEINAINSATEDLDGSILYLNLEPCNHYGKTPPCTSMIIKKGIRRVVIGMEDPNPIVSGRGIRELERAGIEVKVGMLERECRRLNESYIKYITTKRPFVILKIATTLDGKIGDPEGKSKWITNEKSRKRVHKIRSIVDAVMVGVGTVKRDNPLLTVRSVKGRNPHRVIVDTHLSIPINALVLEKTIGVHTMIATTYKAPVKKVEEMRKKGAELIFVPYTGYGVDLNALMKELGKRKITSLLIEGGSRLSTSAIRQRIVDKILFFYAPKILGGMMAYPMFLDLGINNIGNAIPVMDVRTRRVGNDFFVEGYLKDATN